MKVEHSPQGNEVIDTKQNMHKIRLGLHKNDRRIIEPVILDKRIKKRPPGVVICPICGGLGHVMVKASPRSHKATKKIMCPQCIGNGYLKEKIAE